MVDLDIEVKTRIIDELGRITVPYKMREELNFNSGDKIDMFLAGNYIVLCKNIK